MNGYNCSIFAYGQTGSGKTYTIFGNETSVNHNFSWEKESNMGIIFRAATHFFEELNKLDDSTERSVTVSFIEIYNEEIRDLLSEEKLVPLRIYEDKTKTVHVKDLMEVTVLNAWDIYELLKKGNDKRQTASTLMNRQSSRSHTVFTITVSTLQNISRIKDLSIISGKLNLIDLAGSENIAKSGSTDQRAREASNINQSLLTLGRVIKALVEKSPHIPYRESKLTRILQDSLGGQTKTSIIATISPGAYSKDETLNTLDYASSARNVTNCPMINLRSSSADNFVKEEIIRLKRDLFATVNEQGIYMDKQNYTEMTQSLQECRKEIVAKHEKIKNLQQQIENFMSQEKEWENLRKSFEITNKALMDQKNENKLEKHKMEETRKLANLYQSESDRFRESIDYMLKKDSFLHTKVTNLNDKSLSNLNSLKSLTNAVDKMMNDLDPEHSENFQKITKMISAVIKFNDNIFQVFDNVKAQLAENANKRTEELTTNVTDSNDPLLKEIGQIHDNLNIIVNKINSHKKEIQQLYKSIRLAYNDIVLAIERTKNCWLEKIEEKEEQVKKKYEERDENLDIFLSNVKDYYVRKNSINNVIDEELEENLKEQERLAKRKQRLVNMLKLINDNNIQEETEEYVKKQKEIRTEICDFTNLKEKIILKDFEKIDITQIVKNVKNDESLIGQLESVPIELRKVISSLQDEHLEVANTLEQVCNVFDLEGKIKLTELKETIELDSQDIQTKGVLAKSAVRQILTDCIDPIAPISGDTPQPIQLPIPRVPKLQLSAIKRLSLDNSNDNINT